MREKESDKLTVTGIEELLGDKSRFRCTLCDQDFRRDGLGDCHSQSTVPPNKQRSGSLMGHTEVGQRIRG